MREPRTDAPMPIEDALQRLQRAIERLWQLAEDGGDTWDAHQAERALQRIRADWDAIEAILTRR